MPDPPPSNSPFSTAAVAPGRLAKAIRSGRSPIRFSTAAVALRM